MDITSLGHASFRIKGKKTTIVTDPYDPSIGFKFPKVSADIVTISHDHQDHNQEKLVSGSPFVISAPGEYEVKGVFILGVDTFHDTTSGSQRGKNTCCVFEVDRLRLCHLGDLGHKLDDTQLEEIGSVDILMIPTGGVYTIGPKRAVEVVSQIQPAVVIPMHYKTQEHNKEVFAKLSEVDEFVEQMGEKPQKLPKLVISKERLPEEQEIVLLEAKHG